VRPVRAPARGARSRRRAAAERAARTPFDLERGPLFRARLLRLDVDEHVLLLCMHHAVTDEWSEGVLLRELEALYAGFSRRGAALPALPAAPGGDFAAWQRGHLAGETLERLLGWWTRRLAGAPAALELPADRPRPPVQSFRGARHDLTLDAALTGRLRELGRRRGATPFMTLLAAFDALLARYTGEEDVVVGTPVAGRTRPELEGVVGFLVNTVALRTDCSGDPAFGELLGRVREATLGAWEHQELPFERLVEALAVPARSGPQPAVPGSVRPPGRPAPGARAPRRARRAGGGRDPHGQARPHLGGPGPGGRSCWYRGVRHGPVRGGHDREDGRALPDAVGSGRRAPGAAPRRAAAHGRRGARAGGEGVEPRLHGASRPAVHDLVADQAARTPDATAWRRARSG
jgi:hypothetical protein